MKRGKRRNVGTTHILSMCICVRCVDVSGWYDATFVRFKTRRQRLAVERTRSSSAGHWRRTRAVSRRRVSQFTSHAVRRSTTTSEADRRPRSHRRPPCQRRTTAKGLCRPTGGTVAGWPRRRRRSWGPQLDSRSPVSVCKARFRLSIEHARRASPWRTTPEGVPLW